MDKISRIKAAWNEWSDTTFAKYHTDESIAKIIKQPESAFHHTTFSMIQDVFPNLKGKIGNNDYGKCSKGNLW